jgi:SAM-dependent methyltransferase
MLTELQYRLLRKISPGGPSVTESTAFEGKSKLRMSLGDELLAAIPGKTVIDFGCGDGLATLDIARFGAKKVIGIDIRNWVLEIASKRSSVAGLSDRCEFVTSTKTPADVIVSLDAFEHFEDPAGILGIMYDLLKPGGCVITSFGPTWYHPLGGHLFSIFPWSHLVFSEEALIRWRAHIRSDGATRFANIDGGLNQMTIGRFERLVAASGFQTESIEAVPIRKLRPVHCRLTREFTSSIVRAKLTRKP